MNQTRPSAAGPRPTQRLFSQPRRSWLWLLTLLTALSGCAAPLARPAAVVASATDVGAVLGGAQLAFSEAFEPVPAVDRPATLPPVASAEVTLEPPVDPPVAVEATAPECPAEDIRVLLVGDSLSVGLGPAMAKLARQCGTSFHHHGVVGAHVTQWVQDSWLLPQLERAKPNVVVVSLGGNDFQRNDPEAVEAAIARFVSKVRDSGATLLWISPPTMPFDDAIGARDMWQDAIGGAVERDWYPTEALTIPRAPDRVHPTIAGYHDLGRTLWQWIAVATA